MGMFSSLFGKSGSDKADKMRQKAIDAFNAIQTPELKDLQVQLDKYVQTGQLTPEQAESQLLSSNAFNDIVTDPSLKGAQKQALSQLQSVATQGGLTAVDKAQLNDITNQQNQEARSRNEAVMQGARERGMGGSDISTVNQLMNEQAAADRAANSGLGVAAQAQARALQAMQAAGKQAGDVRTQDYEEAAKKAEAENAIDLFNKQTLNNTNLYNVDAANKAQAANLAEQQRIADTNTQTANQNKLYNAQQVQQQFQDQMNKASGMAGTFNGWANDATNAAAADKSADVGFTTGLIKAGAQGAATAFGGPAAGAAMGGATASSPQFGTVYKPTDREMGYADGGEVSMDRGDFQDEHNDLIKTLRSGTAADRNEEANEQEEEMHEYGMTPHHPDHPQHLAMGGHVHCYAHGGKISHHPECYMAKGGKTPDLKTPPLRIESTEHNTFVPQDPSWTLKDPHGEPIGDFKNYDEAADFERKVREKQPNVKDFLDGGKVPGTPTVPHNSVKNDVVDAKLSPGEVVVPLDAQKSDEDFEKFMEQFKPSKKAPKIDRSVPLDKQALANLHKRMGR